LFDPQLRAARRDRAFRNGPELFLYERAFSDCLERLSLIRRRFDSAMLLGCPDPSWPERLGAAVARVEVFDPGPCFAQAVSGSCVVEESWRPSHEEYDLCLAIGTLDSVNQLPQLLHRLRFACRADAPFLGAIAGGNSLPALRAAMHAADFVAGSASPHVHPRIEARALAALLGAAGFVMPVVDVDRITVSYPTLQRLVDDLRAMGATNVLRSRSRKPLTRAAREAGLRAFAAAGSAGRTAETFEILHFAAWTPVSHG
jgi:hypothetical protein